MKFRVILDDADGFDDGIAQAVFRNNWPADVDDDQDTMVSARSIALRSFMKKWVDNERYVQLEFDPEGGTVSVVPVKA